MKVGDKLICKKYFKSDGVILSIGRKYEIDNIESNGVRIKFNNIHYILFSLYENKFCGNIYDYFYSPEEIRLKKLDSI